MPGRAPEPSRSRVDDDGGDRTFRGFLIGYVGFSVNEVFMGEGRPRERPVGPTPCAHTPGGGAVPLGVVGAA